jgi:hypothetical protein
LLNIPLPRNIQNQTKQSLRLAGLTRKHTRKEKPKPKQIKLNKNLKNFKNFQTKWITHMKNKEHEEHSLEIP